MIKQRLENDVEREHYVLMSMPDAAREIVSLFFSPIDDDLTGSDIREITKERLCAACGAARLGKCDQNTELIVRCVIHWSGLGSMSADLKEFDIEKAVKNLQEG